MTYPAVAARSNTGQVKRLRTGQGSSQHQHSKARLHGAHKQVWKKARLIHGMKRAETGKGETPCKDGGAGRAGVHGCRVGGCRKPGRAQRRAQPHSSSCQCRRVETRCLQARCAWAPGPGRSRGQQQVLAADHAGAGRTGAKGRGAGRGQDLRRAPRPARAQHTARGPSNGLAGRICGSLAVPAGAPSSGCPAGRVRPAALFLCRRPARQPARAAARAPTAAAGTAHAANAEEACAGRRCTAAATVARGLVAGRQARPVVRPPAAPSTDAARTAGRPGAADNSPRRRAKTAQQQRGGDSPHHNTLRLCR